MNFMQRALNGLGRITVSKKNLLTQTQLFDMI